MLIDIIGKKGMIIFYNVSSVLIIRFHRTDLKIYRLQKRTKNADLWSVFICMLFYTETFSLCQTVYCYVQSNIWTYVENATTFSTHFKTLISYCNAIIWFKSFSKGNCLVNITDKLWNIFLLQETLLCCLKLMSHWKKRSFYSFRDQT